MVAQDLSLLHRTSPKVAALPPPEWDLLPWYRLISAHPREWKTLVAKARPAIDALVWQRGGRTAPQVRDPAPQVHADQEGVQHCCPDRERAFQSNKALTMHMVTMHKHTSEVAARATAASNTCRVAPAGASKPSSSTCQSSHLPHRARPSSHEGAKSRTHAALASHLHTVQ
eukprot:6008151-Alexandrium_andersonii.AAC.1